MFRYLPITLGVIAIFGLTAVQIVMTDRFDETNVTAEQRAKLLANVPLEFGEWKGEDQTVSSEVRDTAGAIGCVSRMYTNLRTGEKVRLWLIVGHSRDISSHTPDVCFPSSGFSQRSPTHSLYTFQYDGQTDPGDAKFWTNTFVKEDSYFGRQLERVFWAWYNPRKGEPVAWRAETNPHAAFGNTRGLFKMYFTSEMRDINETTEESAAKKFGTEFLPIIDRVLSRSEIGEAETGKAADSQDAA